MEEENKTQVSGKRPFWQWAFLGVVVVIVVYGLVYYFVLAKQPSSQSMTSAASSMKPTMAPKPTAGTAMQKFSDSSDYQYSYKIFPGALASESKQAMAGFAMTTKVMPDGSTQVTLTAQNPLYKTQQYMVKPGDTLYFIERNLKDDDPEKDTDKMMLDDTAILVDPQGNIIQ